MKQLYFVRHAKAEKEAKGHKDFDRELAYKGKTDASRMGNLISKELVKPGCLVSSPAIRALQTAHLFAEQLDFEKSEIELQSDIYEASMRVLLNVINNLDDKHDCIMIFGHNPSFSHLPEYLTQDIIGKVPTCGVLLINFEVDSWKLISSGTGTVKGTWFPEKEI